MTKSNIIPLDTSVLMAVAGGHRHRHGHRRWTTINNYYANARVTTSNASFSFRASW